MIVSVSFSVCFLCWLVKMCSHDPKCLVPIGSCAFIANGRQMACVCREWMHRRFYACGWQQPFVWGIEIVQLYLVAATMTTFAIHKHIHDQYTCAHSHAHIQACRKLHGRTHTHTHTRAETHTHTPTHVCARERTGTNFVDMANMVRMARTMKVVKKQKKKKHK